MRRIVPTCRVIGLTGLTGAVMTVGGCGISATQEYSRIRSIVVPAQPGDGSVIASVGPSLNSPGLAKAIASADRGRGHASDSVVVGD